MNIKHKNKLNYKTVNFFSNDVQSYDKREYNNIIQCLKIEKYITDLWIKRGIKWEN
jgi:hypothetical protein